MNHNKTINSITKAVKSPLYRAFHRFLFVFVLSFIACNNNPMKKLDIEGHRGCRGLMPENTIPAFLHAIDLGVTTLELDVVMSKDHIVIVSHEPWLSHEFCLDLAGLAITDSTEQQYNLYAMTYAEIGRYDCGSKPHPRFPQQKKMPAYKPSLADMIDACEKHSQSKICYNIEVKRVPEHDGIFHPHVEVFTQAVIDVIVQKGIIDRTTFQSFDMQCLRLAHQYRPNLTLALLVESNPDAQVMLDSLGFMPQKYSPYYQLVTPELVQAMHAQNIQVVPWTVNEVTDMKKMIQAGVDGIITDYPDRLLSVVGSVKMDN